MTTTPAALRYLTPGPTQLHPHLAKYLEDALRDSIPSISHRSDQFREIFKLAANSIKKLLNVPDEYHIFFVGSATECMERIIENCSISNTLHFVNGVFSRRFFEIGSELKRNAVAVEAQEGEGFNINLVNIPKNAEIVCVTQNETSSGVSIPLQDISSIKKLAPDSILAIDIVSSAPYVKLDFKSVDCAFFSVQKGFGLPAGLGTLIVGPRCISRAEEIKKSGTSIGSFHSLLSLLTHAKNFETPETPNVLGIYLLGKIALELLQNISTIRNETEAKAELIYSHFDKHATINPLVSEKKFRSKTVIVLKTPDGSKAVIEKLKKKGLLIGTGHGASKDKQIRIANFPMHSLQDMQTICDTIT